MHLEYIQNTLTTHPYGIALQLYTAYGAAYSGTWCAETALQYIAHSSLGDFSANERGCANALNYLNQKLEAIRKTISFWDAYQIVDADDIKESLLDKLAQIPNNASVVNNVPGHFSWLNPSTNEEEDVYRGDTFIKDYLGTIHLIHASNKGVYKPISMVAQSGNSLSIVYQYTNDISQQEVTVSPSGGSIALQQDSAYNQRGLISSPSGGVGGSMYCIPIPALSVSGTYITPIVKFFKQNPNLASGQNEQVILEYTYYGPTGTYYDVETSTTKPILDPVSGEATTGWVIKNPTLWDLWYEVR